MPLCTGNTFAETTGFIRRCKDVTYRVAKLNEAGWRQNKEGDFFFRLVIPVQVESVNVSDETLARGMIEAAQKILEDRLSALEPKDGVERVVVKRTRKSMRSELEGAVGG